MVGCPGDRLVYAERSTLFRIGRELEFAGHAKPKPYAGPSSLMPLAMLLILPFALLAWPVRQLLGASTTGDGTSVAGDSLDWESSMASVAILGMLIAVSIAMHQRLKSSHSNWRVHRVLSDPFFWGWTWVVLQPVVLAISHWTVTIEQLYGKYPSVALFLFLAMVPGYCMFAGLGIAKWRSMSMLPIVAMMVLSLGVDVTNVIGSLQARAGIADSGIATMPGSNAAFEFVPYTSSDLWSWPIQDPKALSGMIALLLVSGLIGNIMLPSWIVWCTRSEPMSDEQSIPIRAVWCKLGLSLPKILFWPTGCRFSNAVLTGNALSRKLLLTDRLLLQFTEREINWIVLHEAAHALRRHAWIRWLPSLLAIPLLSVALGCTEGYVLVVACTAISVLFATSLVGTCWWTEHDADRYAIKLGVAVWGMESNQAVREYSQVMEKLYRDNGIRRISWSHPSLSQRLGKLGRGTVPACLVSNQTSQSTSVTI